MSELGKFSRDPQFKSNVTEFFWDIICNSDIYKEELVNNCITKFCEMVKTWEMKFKHEFFLGLAKNLSLNKSSISSLKLFKGLIKDQKDRFQFTSINSAAVIEGQQPDMTLVSSISILINEANLVDILLNNFTEYCIQATSKITAELDLSQRKKLVLVNPKYSHNEEVDERLQFLKYLATISPDYQISKSELEILYKLLVTDSKVQSDQDEFLTWCKSSCEQSTTIN